MRNIRSRRGAQGLQISSEGQISDVPAQPWRELVSRSSFFGSYLWLSAFEKTHTYVPRYILAWDGDQLVGALPAYLATGGGPESYSPLHRLVQPTLERHLDHDAWLPVLLGGLAAGYQNELLLHPDLSPSGRYSVLDALCKSFLDLRVATAAKSVAFMYLTTSARDELVRCMDCSRQALFSGSCASLRVRWTSFEGYLDWLPRRKRENVRRGVRQFESRGFDVRVGRLSEWLSQAAPLMVNLLHKYGQSDTLEQVTRYLAAQVQDLDDQSVVFTASDQGRLVAFVHFYQNGERLVARSAGFDYEATDGSSAYFNLLIYEPLRYALAHGYRVLELGTTADAAKMLRGATLEPRWSLVLPPAHSPIDWDEVVLGNAYDECRWWRDFQVQPERDSE